MENPEFVARFEDAGKRLDQFLAAAINRQAGKDAGFSRAKVQVLIKEGCVKVNGNPVVKPKFLVTEGDLLDVRLPAAAEAFPVLEAEKILLDILFEDDDLIVVNKPHGLVVHPGSGNASGTLVNALLYHCGKKKLSQAGDPERPGIVHRLDKDTSGCIVVAKTDSAYRHLVGQFSGRETNKEYIAIVEGVPLDEEGSIVTHIGRHPIHRQRMTQLSAPQGKEAISHYRVEQIGANQDWSRIRYRIETGRTHQIRVHSKESLRCPILGDPIYAKPARQKVKVPRLMLHAHRLSLSHPTSKLQIEFEAPTPDCFEAYS